MSLVAEKPAFPAPPGLIADGGTHNLGRRTVRGGAIVFAAVLLERTIGLGILAVLARLLTPEDYGLFGMVLVMTAFLGIFQDLGLSLAAVQKADLTHAQVSTLFWINLGFGVLLSALAAAAAPLVAAFYGEPRLVSVTLWCALGFTLAALGTQHGALLRRRMQFGRLALCQVGSLLVGGALGIGMALRGYGVHALVAQTLGAAGTRGLLTWVFAAWIPGRLVRGSGVRGMLRFGGYLTAFNVLNYFARNLDKVLLGRFWGAAPLGLYTRAYTLMMLPIGLVSAPMATVMIPALAKLQRDEARLRQAYLRSLQIIGLASFPIMALLLMTAEEVIAVVFGPRWSAAAPLFRVLCIAGFWQGIYNATGQVFVASGRTDRMWRVGMAASAVLTAAFAVGLPWGPQGVAWAYALGLCGILLPYLRYTYATVCLGLGQTARQLWGPLLSSLAVIPAVAVAKFFVPSDLPAVFRLGVCLLVGGATFSAAAFVTCPAVVKQAARHVFSLVLPSRVPEQVRPPS